MLLTCPTTQDELCFLSKPENTQLIVAVKPKFRNRGLKFDMGSTRSLLSTYRDSMSLDEDRRWKNAYDNEKNAPGLRKRLPRPTFLLSLFVNVGLIIFVLLKINILQGSNTFCSSNVQAEHYPVSNSGPNDRNESLPASKFAGLVRDIPKQWSYNVATTEEAWVELWNSNRFYAGIISLPDAYAQDKGLPRSQRWPWDPTRGIYILNGFHNFHCVLFIKQSLEEYRDGTPQSVPWPHIQHCLLILRDDIMCNADDTPRYTGFQNWGASGYGQSRMCRNWTQLEDWALQPEQESCWRNIPGVMGDKPGDHSNQLLERYRFCSDQNPYKEQAETAWRDSADWEGQGVVGPHYGNTDEN